MDVQRIRNKHDPQDGLEVGWSYRQSKDDFAANRGCCRRIMNYMLLSNLGKRERENLGQYFPPVSPTSPLTVSSFIGYLMVHSISCTTNMGKRLLLPLKGAEAKSCSQQQVAPPISSGLQLLLFPIPANLFNSNSMSYFRMRRWLRNTEASPVYLKLNKHV